jgi:hypothetical protein
VSNVAEEHRSVVFRGRGDDPGLPSLPSLLHATPGGCRTPRGGGSTAELQELPEPPRARPGRGRARSPPPGAPPRAPPLGPGSARRGPGATGPFPPRGPEPLAPARRGWRCGDVDSACPASSASSPPPPPLHGSQPRPGARASGLLAAFRNGNLRGGGVRAPGGRGAGAAGVRGGLPITLSITRCPEPRPRGCAARALLPLRDVGTLGAAGRAWGRHTPSCPRSAGHGARRAHPTPQLRRLPATPGGGATVLGLGIPARHRPGTLKFRDFNLDTSD